MSQADPAGETDDTDVAPGAVLAGKYRVEKVLGKGGMGVVLLAHDDMLGRRVALKFLHEHLCYEKTVVGRFLREARLAAKIQSEHV
ncbi:MAG: serine/threonine protein kinase, partial [Polyangiaceae bacterium]